MLQFTNMDLVGRIILPCGNIARTHVVPHVAHCVARKHKETTKGVTG